MEEQGGRASYWMSYSDLATCLLLAFILIIVSMLLVQVQAVKAIVGVREQLIEELRDAFSQEHQAIRVDEKTGALEMPSELLFEFNSSVLSAQGKRYLDEFIPTYLAIVLAPKYERNMAEIVVEGHADTVGSYLTNLEFSHARAYAVLSYLTTMRLASPDRVATLRQLASANGRSESDPIIDAEGHIDNVRSRRVVFKFRLRDDAAIQKIKELLGQ